LPLAKLAAATPEDSLSRAELIAIDAAGGLEVRLPSGRVFSCDHLDSGGVLVLCVGDTLLVLPPDASGRGIVLGRIGPYRAPEPPARLTLEATEVLTLKCGDATLDLRADGKAVLKGEDVLIRAKGLQRIKAGSVSIN
jgi:hypothetical protein